MQGASVCAGAMCRCKVQGVCVDAGCLCVGARCRCKMQAVYEDARCVFRCKMYECVLSLCVCVCMRTHARCRVSV